LEEYAIFSVDAEEYSYAEINQWNKRFRTPEEYPCNDPSFTNLTEIQKDLYFRFACPDPSSGALAGKQLYRPYFITKDGRLAQIPFDYDGVVELLSFIII